MAGYPAGEQPDSVAVMEFAMIQDEEGENWAAGLSDFAMSLLQEYGAATFERKDLNYIFSEYRLHEQGFVKPEQIVRQKLPWVRYLLNGTIEKKGETDFSLTVSLTDMQSASEVARFSQAGKYPDGLAAAVQDSIRQTSQRIGKPEALQKKNRDRPGFTNSPEVALLYYKGLDYYNKGRPEYAEYYFREAYYRDNGFVTAGLWRMRAFEKLGLEDCADYVYRMVAKQLIPGGENDSSDRNSLAGKQLVAGVLRPFDPELQDDELESALRSAIINNARLQLFAHESIDSITQELDLELTGDFARHSLHGQEWMSADVHFSIYRKRGNEGEGEIVTIQMINAVTGEIVGRGEKARKSDSLAECINTVLDGLLAENTSEANEQLSLTYVKAPIDQIKKQIHALSHIARESYLLRRFSDDQENREKLVNYIGITNDMTHPMNGFEWDFVELLFKRLEKLVDPAEPEAPFWYYFIQWGRIHQTSFDIWTTQKDFMVEPRKDGKLFEKYFHKLVTDYPDSLPANLAKFAIGFDKIYAEDYPAAFRYFDSAAQSIGSSNQFNLIYDDCMYKCETVASRQEILANIYYFAAKVASDVGEMKKAWEYSEKAFQATREYYALHGLDWSSDLKRVIPGMLSLYPVEGKWLLTRMMNVSPNLTVRDGFKNEVKNLSLKISGGNAVDEELTLEQIRDFLNTWKTTEAEKYELGLQYLRRVTEEIGRSVENAKKFDIGVRNISRSVVTNMPAGKEGEVASVMNALIYAYKKHYDAFLKVCPDHKPHSSCHPVDKTPGDKSPFPMDMLSFDRLMLDLYIVFGQFNLVLDQADDLLSSRWKERRLLGIVGKAWVLSEKRSSGETAAFVNSERIKYEKDFSADLGQEYIELISWNGNAYIEANESHLALDVYRRGVENASPGINQESYCDKKSGLASLIYHQASLEEKLGNRFEAIELFKNVVRLGEKCQAFSLMEIGEKKKRVKMGYPSQRFYGSRSNAYDKALKKIDEIRTVDADRIVQ